MRKKQLTLTLCALLLCVVTATAQNPLQLKLVRGMQDTVYNAKHNLIGHIVPGSQVEINNQSVKVYATGSFGMPVSLKPGSNLITITAVNKQLSTDPVTITHSIYLSDKPGGRPAVETVEQIDTLFNIITKENAYLNYSAGGDRLGGAKINFIDQGIVMKVVGISGSLYRVQLSDNRYAFIPQSCCEPVGQSPAQVITGSWYVSNTGNEDKVSIALGARLPYIAKEKRFPTRIEIDLYGAKCNTNWITQMLDTKMIESVDFEQVDTDQFRVIIYLGKEHSWGYRIGYENNNLAIYVKHQPQLSLKGMKIGIDAGHGGTSTGAMSPSGLKEKDLNLEMTYMLKEMLEKEGAVVVLSRTDDRDVSQLERKLFFINNKVDLMLSIHCNAGGNPFIPMGTSTYYKQIHNRDFAESVLQRLLELNIPNFGLVGNFNFYQNTATEYPNILVETLFMSSLPDEEQLADRQYRQKMMRKVVLGIKDYLAKCKLQ